MEERIALLIAETFYMGLAQLLLDRTGNPPTWSALDRAREDSERFLPQARAAMQGEREGLVERISHAAAREGGLAMELTGEDLENHIQSSAPAIAPTVEEILRGEEE